ncbi:MAG: NADH-quinone oxidoreductase subunit NuoK [Chloroflexi bacterium]|nr:NADH-quinone oxidoreductase subunit NuoK [Chloroflexota bacterium]MYC07501.1 NADH-quinone oxidoreductase subunit NuoK [Chloroflexota bacterium]
MSLENFLIVAAIIFAIGLYGAITKQNAIAVLMSLELMFNAVNISAVAMSRYIVPASIAQNPQTGADQAVQFLLTGQVFTVFIITVAAAEVALGLAIVLSIFRQRASIFVSDAAELKN